MPRLTASSRLARWAGSWPPAMSPARWAAAMQSVSWSLSSRNARWERAAIASSCSAHSAVLFAIRQPRRSRSAAVASAIAMTCSRSRS